MSQFAAENQFVLTASVLSTTVMFISQKINGVSTITKLQKE
jgi:hypothetical protein